MLSKPWHNLVHCIHPGNLLPGRNYCEKPDRGVSTSSFWSGDDGAQPAQMQSFPGSQSEASWHRSHPSTKDGQGLDSTRYTIGSPRSSPSRQGETHRNSEVFFFPGFRGLDSSRASSCCITPLQGGGSAEKLSKSSAFTTVAASAAFILLSGGQPRTDTSAAIKKGKKKIGRVRSTSLSLSQRRRMWNGCVHETFALFDEETETVFVCQSPPFSQTGRKP